LVFAYDPSTPHVVEQAHDRQIRTFGEEGQRILGKLNVAVIGAGGTGSVTVQQLVHLGVSQFLLIDPDVVEETNLNRLVGATPRDVGNTPKVEVAARTIRSVRPNAKVVSIRGDVTEEGIAKRLRDVDFIFCCTDSHASRHLINQLSYQYLIPAIDVGVAINRARDDLVQMAGRVTMLGPGLPCLWCAEQLDPNQVRRDLMNAEQREADPYIIGFSGIVQPSVISLNSTVASLAVTMFLSAVVGVPSSGRYVVYDGNRSRVTTLSVDVNLECNFCSTLSSAGEGDAYPLPVRRSG
jgi:molybdopterin/thiamine biosynthesis adenylyltransferase